MPTIENINIRHIIQKAVAENAIIIDVRSREEFRQGHIPMAMNVPVIFARKHKSLTLKDDLYTASVYSYTKETTNQISISKKYVSPTDKVLLIDDFLANGQALEGMLQIAQAAGVEVAGAGIVIEKTFQKGGQELRKQGLRIESLAKVSSLANGKAEFED